MKTTRKVPGTIDEYIAAFPPDVAAVLERVRQTIRKAAPDGQEKISYRMPAFAQDGDLVYFGGFKQHIGLYPPVRDAKLKKEAARYAGPKGNLQFPFDEPIPYGLIGRIVKARLKENRERAAQKRK